MLYYHFPDLFKHNMKDESMSISSAIYLARTGPSDDSTEALPTTNKQGLRCVWHC